MGGPADNEADGSGEEGDPSVEVKHGAGASGVQRVRAQQVHGEWDPVQQGEDDRSRDPERWGDGCHPCCSPGT